MQPVAGLFYKVELSNGKTFEAVKCTVINSKDTPDVNNVCFSIINTTYEAVKELISEDITSIKVKQCRPTSPPDYISEPDVIQEDLYDKFGANPSIEPYYSLGFNIRFFEITDDLLVQNKQYEELKKTSDSLINLYEN